MNKVNLDRVEILLNRGEYGMALKICRDVIDSEPINAAAYQFASVALANMGNNFEALNMSNKALEADPSLVIPHTINAMVYDVLGEREKSRKEAGIALDKNPESPDALCCSGILSLSDNKLDDAERFLKRATRLNPSFYLAHYNLATVYQNKKNPKKLLQQTLILFRLRPSINSIFRLMYILSRVYKFLPIPIILFTASIALKFRAGTEAILVVSLIMMLVWFAGGIYIGLMAEMKQGKRLINNIMTGSTIALLGIVLYILLKYLLGT